MSFLTNIYRIFFPRTCLYCNKHLVENEFVLCSTCRHELPVSNYVNTPNNSVERSFYGRVPIVSGAGLLFYRKKGVSQELIHHLKYQNRQDIGDFFGLWLGEELKNSTRFLDIDGIIIVPLHPKKLKQRGYNQLTKFGETLSKKLEVPLIKNVLIKTRNTISQTKKSRINRFDKIKNAFHIENEWKISGKHILLVDDVITTGATLEACANELLKIEGVKVSIATMVISDSF